MKVIFFCVRLASRIFHIKSEKALSHSISTATGTALSMGKLGRRKGMEIGMSGKLQAAGLTEGTEAQ